ncbi:MAG TPA: hypothetical protein VGM54_19635 [Chthoniobacter sp.]
MLRFLRSSLPLLLLAPALLAEPPQPSGQLAFLRSQDGEKIASLQTLSAEFKPAGGRGPSIWLIGVAHIGTPEYYTALQKRLDAQSTVLFEGVDAKKLTREAKPENKKSLQGKLATALGLVFQLDGINYQRPNFVSCDLTMAGLEKAMANHNAQPPATDSSPGKPAASDPSAPPEKRRGPTLPAKVDNATFDTLMQAIRGEGDIGRKLDGMVGIMGSTPEMRETVKLMFIESFAQAGDIINAAKAASPEIRDLFEVILTERNENVIRQLEARLPQLGPGDTIAVFYGAAHMDQIMERLTTELHYTPGVQMWDTAFTADTTKSMMPTAQIKAIVQMMRTQLQNAPAGKGGGLESLFGLPALDGAADKAAPVGK